MSCPARIFSAMLLAPLGLLPVRAADTADNPTIPAGTSLEVELTTTVSSKSNQTGDLFTGKVTEPVISHGEEVVPESSIVQGHITFLKPPGRAKGRAEMRLVLDSIKTPDGEKYAIAAALQDAKGPDGTTVKDEGTVVGPGKDTKKAAEESGIAAAAGAGVGAIAAGGSGALYGAAIGAVVGVVHTLAKHHGDVVLDPGTEVSFLIPRAVVASKSTTPDALVVPNAH